MKTNAICLLALSLATAAAADDFVKGPWIQNVTTSGIVVMWEADEQEGTAPTVDYGETTGYKTGSVSSTHAPVNGYHVYSAPLTGLSADTVYHYRVTSGSSQSTDATFKTAPAKGTTGFRFYVVGDTFGYPDRWGTIADLIRVDMREYPAHHQSFILNCGDVAVNGSYYADWDEAVPPARRLLAELPQYMSPGNHDDRNTTESDSFIYGYFDFPYASSGSTDEKWYSFDYGNVHLAAMALYDDGGYTSGAQFDWVQDDLYAADSDTQTDWTFVLMHFLPWSIGHHDESQATAIRTYLHPIFRDWNVTCGFGGHNHLYARYAPVDAVTYITSGAGSSPVDGDFSPWSGATLEYWEAVVHYCAVDVEEDAISVRAVDIDGNRIDYVTFGGTPSNRPPFADAGANVSEMVGTPVSLSAAASEDPEGAGLTYEWTQVGGLNVTLSNADTAAPSFTTAIGGDYLFRLRVHDGTYWSAPDFCVATVSSGILTFTPEADTYITDLSPDTNFGSNGFLRLDTEPDQYHSYLRFNVTDVTGVAQVLRATLNLYMGGRGDGGEIRTCPDTTWDESVPTWNNPLPEDGPVVGLLLASLYRDLWLTVDMTETVSGDGAITLVILPGGSDSVYLMARETTLVPELVVKYVDDLHAQDSDSDGLSNYDEIYWDGDAGYDPYHPVTNPTGTDLDTVSGDTDDDGFSDTVEFIGGSDPRNASSTPPIIRINFQPASSSRPTDYAPSTTSSFIEDLGYGWQ